MRNTSFHDVHDVCKYYIRRSHNAHWLMFRLWRFRCREVFLPSNNNGYAPTVWPQGLLLTASVVRWSSLRQHLSVNIRPQFSEATYWFVLLNFVANDSVKVWDHESDLIIILRVTPCFIMLRPGFRCFLLMYVADACSQTCSQINLLATRNCITCSSHPTQIMNSNLCVMPWGASGIVVRYRRLAKITGVRQ